MYNVSSYLDDHPGGKELLLSVAGKDATAAFDDAAHSEDAHEMMERLLVGKLPLHEQPSTATFQAINRTLEVVTPSIPVPRASMARTVWCAFGAGTAFVGVIAALPTKSLTGGWASKTGSLLVKTPDRGLRMGGFWSGVLATASVSVVLALALGLRLKALTARHKPRDSYPRYIRPTIPLSFPGPDKRERQILDPKSYQKLPLIEKQEIARNVYRFVLKLPDTTTPLGLPLGQHIRLAAELDGQRVQRSYTPTSQPDACGTLELTVKVYPQGKIGNYLLSLPLNAEVSVSGPFGRFRDYYPGKWDRIGCIAGGTGITPIYQVVRAICENPADKTNVSILYGNEMQEDILLQEEIGKLAGKYPEKLSVHHVLARPPSGWEGETGWITRDIIEKRLPLPGEKTGYLLCGTEGMVKAMKQHLEGLGGRELVSNSSRVFVF